MDFLDEKTYVDQAKDVLDALLQPKKNKDGIIIKDRYGNPITPALVSTSKIRSILSMAADIYDNVLQNMGLELNSDLVARIEYLRVRMIYEAGREAKVKTLLEKAKLIEYAKMIGNDKNRFILFYHYMEALVAFHRYYGGKDN